MSSPGQPEIYLFNDTLIKEDTSFFLDRVSSNVLEGSQRIFESQKRLQVSLIMIPHEVSFNTQEGEREGVRVTKNIRLFGEATIADVDSFRFGKDVKSVKNLLNDKLLTNITLGRENNIGDDASIDNSLEYTNYGQNNLYNTYDIVGQNFIPYDDIIEVTKPENLIGKSYQEKEGYPFAYSVNFSYPKFRSPDVSSLDGSIDIFNLKQLPLEAGSSDIQIKGVRGLLGVGNWELSQNTTLGAKGSTFLDDKFEKNQPRPDFFEDAAETLLDGAVIIEGFISNNTYLSSPFIEQEVFKNQYEHLTQDQKNNLLPSSSMSEFSVGTRFKSRDNGFIMTPFYQLTEQRSFGTDSLAFKGLLKG